MSRIARRGLIRGRLRLRIASSTTSSAKYRIVTVRFGFHGTASSIRPSSASTWSMPSSFTNATQSALSTGRAETSFIARMYLGPADSTTSLAPSKTGSGSAATATVLSLAASLIQISRGHPSPLSVSEAVHRDVLDHGLIEPDIMVGAGIGGVSKNGAAPPGARIQRRDHTNRAVAPVSPDPARHRHAVTVTKRMHDRSHTRQIPAPGRETVIEPVSLGRLSDHPWTLLRVTRPPFDQLSQRHDPAATVVACQQRRQIHSAQHRARPADRLAPLTNACAAALPRNTKRVRHRASLYPRRSAAAPRMRSLPAI